MNKNQEARLGMSAVRQTNSMRTTLPPSFPNWGLFYISTLGPKLEPDVGQRRKQPLKMNKVRGGSCVPQAVS